jgi:hypothetical protein
MEFASEMIVRAALAGRQCASSDDDVTRWTIGPPHLRTARWMAPPVPACSEPEVALPLSGCDPDGARVCRLAAILRTGVLSASC